MLPNVLLPLMSNDGPPGDGWLRTFCVSIRTCKLLFSVIRNVLLADASNRTVPKLFTTFGPSVPLVPGIGFLSRRRTVELSERVIAPGVFAGTFSASALSVQRWVVTPTACFRLCLLVTTSHWGSGIDTNRP